MVSALQHPQYRRYWSANLAAAAGQQIMWVAQGWLVYDITDSALQLGYTGLLSALPAIGLSLVGGVYADRVDSRKMIAATQVAAGALTFALALLTAFDVVRVWHIFVVAFLSGALQAFNNPARQTIFPQLVDRKDLMNAISLNSVIWQATRIVAPAVGGVIVATAGTATAFFLGGFGMLAMAFVVWGLKVERQPRRQGESLLREFTEGLRFVRDNVLFGFLISMTFFNSFFGNSVQQLMPVFARSVLDVGPSGLGFLFSASGVGSLVGISVAGSLGEFEHKGKLITGGAIAFGGFVSMFALSSIYPLSLAALFLMGLFNSLYMILVQTTLQVRVPDQLRGRVMGIFGMTYNLGPLGAIQAGALADAFGPQTAIASGGIAIVAFTVAAATASSEVRRLQAVPTG